VLGELIGVGLLVAAARLGRASSLDAYLSPGEHRGEFEDRMADLVSQKGAIGRLVQSLLGPKGTLDCPSARKTLHFAQLDAVRAWVHAHEFGDVTSMEARAMMMRAEKALDQLHSMKREFKKRCVASLDVPVIPLPGPVRWGLPASGWSRLDQELNRSMQADEMQYSKQAFLNALRRGKCGEAFDAYAMGVGTRDSMLWTTGQYLMHADRLHARGKLPVASHYAAHTNAEDAASRAGKLFDAACVLDARDVLGPPPKIPTSLDGLRRRRFHAR